MEITCWNCKTVIKLDDAAVAAAVAKMDETKLNFYDVPCTCGKVNRTQRSLFTGVTPAKAGSKATVLARSLHVRGDHSTSAETVAGLVKGQEVDVFETWTDGKNTWARIGEGMWSAVEFNGDKLLEVK